MRIEKRAALTASAVAFLLLIIKFSTGIISGSVAILASAIDSLLDLAISIFNYFALSTSDKEADERFNYGRGKIEAIAAVIEGIIITISGVYILYLSADKILNKAEPSYIVESVIVMLVSTLITGSLVLYLMHVAKTSNSIVIKADALHYKTDLFTNGGILISLFVISLTDWFIIDAIVGIVIAIYIIYSAYGLIKEGTLMLLDVALEPEIVAKIVAIIDGQQGVTSHHWLKTRRSGSDIFISVHLVFNEDISLLKAHQISDKVSAKIKYIDTKSVWHLSIHLDPHDDS